MAIISMDDIRSCLVYDYNWYTWWINDKLDESGPWVIKCFVYFKIFTIPIKKARWILLSYDSVLVLR